MKALSDLRTTFFGDRRSRGGTQADAEQASAPEAGPPFAGYDRLSDRQAMDALSDHSQAELEAVEDYERSHKQRVTVLDKLRYMRGAEPFSGYDEMSVEEIKAALQDADTVTIKKVRAYERKFAKRPDVLDEVARVHGLRQGAEPAAAAPAYQPNSATSGSSPVD
jgi:hypothetical protein